MVVIVDGDEAGEVGDSSTSAGPEASTGGGGGSSSTGEPAGSESSEGSDSGDGGGVAFDIPLPPETLPCPMEPDSSMAEAMRFAVWVPVTGAVVKYAPDGFGFRMPPIGELARYRIAPSNGVTPGGVSVARDGRAAVGSSWGVAVFESGAEGFTGSNWKPCHESDGPTSLGALDGSYWLADPLPYGDDVCLAWGVPIADAAPLAVAWTRGTWDPGACSYSDAEIWAAGADGVRLLDGMTGAELASAPIPAGVGPIADLVVDASGDAWGLVRGESLVHFDHDTLVATVHPLVAPGAGWALAIDHEGRPWVCDATGVARFDAGAWQTSNDWRDTPEADALLEPLNARGCAVSDEGELVYSTTSDAGLPRLRHVTVDLAGYQAGSLPSAVGQPRIWAGASFDAYGSLWLPDQAGEVVLRNVDTSYAAAEWVEGATIVGDAAGNELANLL